MLVAAAVVVVIVVVVVVVVVIVVVVVVVVVVKGGGGEHNEEEEEPREEENSVLVLQRGVCYHNERVFGLSEKKTKKTKFPTNSSSGTPVTQRSVFCGEKGWLRCQTTYTCYTKAYVCDEKG